MILFVIPFVEPSFFLVDFKYLVDSNYLVDSITSSTNEAVSLH